jgi:Spy/CpxP family protein refolding chaperone
MQAMRLHWLLGNDEAIQEIGLTTQQVVALKTIRLETSKQMIDLEAKRQHALLAETELISQEAPNEDAVLKTVEETGAVQIEIAKLRVKSLLKMLKILNAEQRAKLTEVFKRRMEDRRNRFERRQEGRGRNPNQPLAEQPVAAPVATPAATP